MFLEKEKIKEYLAQSPDVNVSVGNNVLLISAALMFGNVEIVKFLIEQGADVNVFVGNNTPLIATAIIFGNAELVKILIETGADIDFKIIDIAIIYGDSEIIKLLIEASNIDINTLFSQTIPSISIAILLGKEDIFKIFIDAGIDSYSGARDIEDYLLLNPADIPKKALKEYRELLKKTNLELDNTMNIIENTKRSVETLLLTVDLKLQSQPDNIQTIIKKEQYLSVRENIFNNLSLYKKKMKFMGQIMQGMQEIINDYDLKSSFHILEKYYALDSMHLIYAVKCGHSEMIEYILSSGVDTNYQEDNGKTALYYAFEQDNEDIMELLIKNGADVNVNLDNGRSLYDSVCYNKQEKLKDLIENSPSFIKPNHFPQKLVKLLTNFTIDKPIKYTTHTWDFGELKKEYGNFDGYMSAVKTQFDSMKSELETLSPNLYKKVYTFLVEKNPKSDYTWCSKTQINIGWSSLEGLKEWCDSGKNPFDFEFLKPISYDIDFETITLIKFKDIINLFKQEIEIRENFKNLENLFANQIENLDTFKVNISSAKFGRQFYTDTEKFSNVLNKIFSEIKTRKKFSNIEITTTELEDRSIEIKITQIDSPSSRGAEELLSRAKKSGDLVDIVQNLQNLCDYSIEASYEDKNFRVNFLHSNNVKDIEILDEKPKGFTHILRFYK